MKVVTDSSVIIDHLRTKGIGKTTKLMRLRSSYEQLIFPLIIVGELFGGKSAQEKEKEIKEILFAGEIAKPDFSLMELAGKIRRETEINLLDAIIAATALRLDLPLATLNIKDFSKVSGIKLYKW